MGEIVRFGVSMDSTLVQLLDELVARNNHDNRSEVIRTLVRDAIVDDAAVEKDGMVVGTLTILYHHSTRIPRVPIDRFSPLEIIANMQFHLKEEIVAKVMIIRGSYSTVEAWANEVLASSDLIGKLTVVATDDLLGELID